MTDIGNRAASAYADSQDAKKGVSNLSLSKEGVKKKAADSSAKPSRGRRSREVTRQKLIDAALRVMAEKGVDGTAINDITEAADVGFGSFYNHFNSKAEIARAVFDIHATELGELTRFIGQREEDRAVAVATIQKTILTKAVADPVWGWFIVHAAVGLPELWRVFAEQGTGHIREGTASGRFTIGCDQTAMRIILAALMATMRDLLEGAAKPAAAEETIECLLRMLGVPGDEARKLSRRKLPAYVTALFQPDDAQATVPAE